MPEKPFRCRMMALLGLMAMGAGLIGAIASVAGAPAPGAAPAVGVPGFWDPRRRPERPNLTRL
ncbi:MAG: transporter substrate-binding domain-containing protein, partial [Xanthobacteraceae bacterium]